MVCDKATIIMHSFMHAMAIYMATRKIQKVIEYFFSDHYLLSQTCEKGDLLVWNKNRKSLDFYDVMKPSKSLHDFILASSLNSLKTSILVY